MMCAATAGRLGQSVLLIDHAEKVGKKILISGGGRCNFTNIHADAANYLCANPHFAKSALGRYSPQDFIDLVDRYQIAWHEKTLGQLFCDGSARQIVDMLVEECRLAGALFALGSAINSIRHDGDQFAIKTDGTTVHASKLVIATGGPSIPKLGASGIAYDIARQFGLKVVEPRPALVPLTLSGQEAIFRDLSGVATDTQVSFQSTRFREASLFTHKGLSGPAILQISSYWKPGEAIRVDFLPDHAAGWLTACKRETPNQNFEMVLGERLPNRLAAALSEKLGASGVLQSFRDHQLSHLESQLRDWPFHPNGTEGFAKAEVTVGGVSTAELSAKTLEAKKQPGLYFIGEAVDVTGCLGGYNFQWAWASGVAAGQALAES